MNRNYLHDVTKVCEQFDFFCLRVKGSCFICTFKKRIASSVAEVYDVGYIIYGFDRLINSLGMLLWVFIKIISILVHREPVDKI